MQIKIEIDVRPDELRRFIGLPDVAGLQDEFVQFLREKLHQAGENFDATAFVKSNLRLLSKSSLLGKLLTPVKDAVGYNDDENGNAAEEAAAATADHEESATRPARKRRRSAARKTGRRRKKPA
jgi:hypothetical protein